MGCQGSSNNRNHKIKKSTNYKGLFKDKVEQDVEKRYQLIEQYKQRVKVIDMEISMLNAEEDPKLSAKKEQLFEMKKTLLDKISIQTGIVEKIMNRLNQANDFPKISSKGKLDLLIKDHPFFRVFKCIN